MALKHVLLGILCYGPRAGYSLHKMFWSPVRPALPQIYRTINEMVDESLITIDRVDNGKQPTRNMCSITEKGYVEFKHWVMEHERARPTREPLMQQLVFSGILDKKDLIAKIEAYKVQKKKELLYYTSRSPKELSRGLPKDTAPFTELCAELVHEYMRRRNGAEVEWARDAIERINDYIPKSSIRVKKIGGVKNIHKALNPKKNKKRN